MKEFYDDKKREATSTKDVKRILEKMGFRTVKENNDFKYDLEVVKDNKKYFVEIKQDFTCYKTNNIGVEYSCRGKLSGIMTSKANIYIYKVHQNPVNAIKAKNEKEIPSEIKIMQVAKTKLKECIEYIINENERELEMASLMGRYSENENKINETKGFQTKTIKTKKGLEYKVTFKLINGGDKDSDSLNVIFKRNSFIENFSLASFENRLRTDIEKKELHETLNLRNDILNKKYNS